MKNYILYLDESGDFDKNLTQWWSNECLVGGLLIRDKDELSHNGVRSIVAKAIRQVVPGLEEMSDYDVFQRFNHATELDKKEEKAEISRSILDAASQCGKFIIFENHARNKVLDSTRTYIYIMVDGILQLLERLIEDNPGEKISLKVIAGVRQDRAAMEGTGNEKKIYITGERYSDILSETLQYQKVKHPNIVKYGNPSIELENDKTFPYLVVADHICNVYFTRTCSPFSEQYADGRSYWDYMSSWYDPDYIFSMQKNSEKELLEHYFMQDDYAAALYDVCAGMISDERNISLIISRFSGMGKRTVNNALSILTGYIHEVVESRDLEKSEKVLSKADEISERLKQNGIVNSEFDLNCRLFMVTILNHQGKINEMGQQFESCRGILQGLLIESGNLEYAFIYYNRYAVYLIDCFRFEEAEKILEAASQLFEAYNLAIGELPGFDINEDEVVSVQKGKILGTLVQCRTALLNRGVGSYEKIMEVSTEACRNLMNRNDKIRQYQYRATAAGVAGLYDEAMQNLCKGFNADDWKKLLAIENSQDGFALYHLSGFARYFADDTVHEKEIGNIIRALKDNDSRYIGQNGHPYFLTSANLATAIVSAGREMNEAEKYFRSAMSAKDEVLLEILSLMVFSEYIGRKGVKAKDEDISSMIGRCDRLLDSGRLNMEIEKILKAMVAACETRSYAQLMEIGKLRQY